MSEDYDMWLDEYDISEVDDRELQDIAFYYCEEDALMAGF